MARNRVIYQSEALYVGPIETGCQVGGAKTWNQDTISGLTPQQLFRVQDVAHSIDIARTDINEFGRLAAIEREIIDSPTVSLDFTYLLADGKNERTLGFIVDGSVNTVSGLIANRRDEQNYYILTVPEGNDATQATNYGATAAGCNGVIGIGNGFVSAYSITAAVGDLPSASVTVNANNILFATGSSGIQNPAVNSSGCKAVGTVDIPHSSTGNMNVAALRPGDVHLDFGSTDLQMGGAILPGSASATDRRSAINIQNFTLDLPIGRTPIQRLGDTYAFAREIDFPVNATMSVSAQLADIESGNLTDLICGNNKRDIKISMQTCTIGGCSLAEAEVPAVAATATITDDGLGNGVLDAAFFTIEVNGGADVIVTARTNEDLGALQFKRTGTWDQIATSITACINDAAAVGITAVKVGSVITITQVTAGVFTGTLTMTGDTWGTLGSPFSGGAAIIPAVPAGDGKGTHNLQFELRNAELESQNFTSSIGANKTVDLTFVGQVGGPQDTLNGVFISGTAAVIGTQTVNYGARAGGTVERAHPGEADCSACPAGACRADTC